MNKIKKTVFTLAVDDYEPKITSLTFPLMNYWADKIGANFHVITKRKFPNMPVTYEKLQIFELGKQMENDWNIFFDADALIHPDMFDPTCHLLKDTVMHNGNDMANNRWRYDEYFLRDGRNIGSCNWFTIASDWCIDLWHPLEDLSLEQALANITPIQDEKNVKGFKIDAAHLLDDYVLSRNIARFGLKFTNMYKLKEQLGRADDDYTWHQYQIGNVDKIERMCAVINGWKVYQYYSKEKGQEIENVARQLAQKMADEKQKAK